MNEEMELTIEEMNEILETDSKLPIKYAPEEPFQEVYLSNGSSLEDPIQCVIYRELLKINPYFDNHTYPKNDKGIVNVVADCLRPFVVFCRDNQKFYVYDNVKWNLDIGSLKTSNLIKQLFLLLTQIYIKEINFEGDDEEQQNENYKKYFKYLEKYDPKPKRDNILSDLKDELVIDFSEFDKNPYLINCKNYTINIQDLTCYEHKASDMITMVTNCDIPFDFMLNGTYQKGKKFKKFFKEIMNGNDEKAKFLQEALGYSLLGTNPKECMFIAYGKTTRNGKSTLFNTIADILGDYGNNTNARFLNKSLSKNDTDKPSPTLASLRGKRFINLQESDKRATFDGALVKQITGNDTLQGRNLHENLSSFKVSGKIWYSCNYLPYIDDKTLFSSDRVVVVEFDKHFSEEERDTTLKSVFAGEMMKSYIFLFLLEGYQMYKKNNLKLPRCIKKAIKNYELTCNPIARFVQSPQFEITKNNKDRIERTKLYETYISWCSNEGISRVNKKSFYEELEAQGFRLGKIEGIRYVIGIKFAGGTSK